MFKRIETIIMWAEYGDALFWHKGSGCCGDSRSLVTDSGKVIDVTGIKGLREWYARYDDDKYPAYSWTPEEYSAWRKEGWKYAQAIRDLIPDNIDLVYEYDGDDTGSPVHRKNRVVPSKPMALENCDVRISRIARGLPAGAAPDVLDMRTVLEAFNGKTYID